MGPGGPNFEIYLLSGVARGLFMYMLYTYIYIYMFSVYIENADATPPHLDFFCCVWVAQAICLVSAVLLQGETQ